jgi:urease accessory protein
MRSALPRTLAAVLMLAPATAFAHTGAGYAQGFYAHGFADGFAHPLGGVDHILAMVTVGILAWQLGGRAIWLVPASFVSLMAIGGAFGIAGEALPWVELGIAASVIVLGTMVALEVKATLAMATAMVGLFAIFHGYAHGSEMPLDASGGAYAAGFIPATALLHVAGIALGFLIGRIGDAYGRLAYQLSGGLVALAGVGTLTHVI